MPITIQPAPALSLVTGVEYIQVPSASVNAAANTVATFANGTLVLADATLNFNNTNTINVVASANGTKQTNVAFQVNVSAISGAQNNYEADVLANGHLVIANANLNYNNTATLNVAVAANGSTQANISFNVNVQAVVSNTEANVTNAVNLVYATNPNWYALYSGAN